MKHVVLCGAVCAILLSALPTVALDNSSLNPHTVCARRGEEYYRCTDSRVVCFRGYTCVGTDPAIGLYIRGSCQWNEERKSGACLATEFAGADGRWYPLSMRDTVPTGPGFQEFQRAPTLEPFPAEFQVNPARIDSGALMSAFDAFDDTPHALIPGDLPPTPNGIQPYTPDNPPPVAGSAPRGDIFDNMQEIAHVLSRGLPPEGWATWREYDFHVSAYNPAAIDTPLNTSYDPRFADTPVATGFRQQVVQTATEWYQAAQGAAGVAWNGVTTTFSSYENFTASMRAIRCSMPAIFQCNY